MYRKGKRHVLVVCKISQSYMYVPLDHPYTKFKMTTNSHLENRQIEVTCMSCLKTCLLMQDIKKTIFLSFVDLVCVSKPTLQLSREVLIVNI